jgi:hypothetical protein
VKRGKGAGLRDALESLVERLDKKGLYARSRVAEAWRTAAGPEIDAHTTGAFLRDGELVIYVDSPVWATELTSLSEMLRSALNEAVGEDLVSSMRFVVSRRVAEERRARDEDDQLRGRVHGAAACTPLDEEERRRIEKAVSVIEDEELRSAVLRAETGSLGRLKAERAAEHPEGKKPSSGARVEAPDP